MKLQISNFRSIERQDVELAPITVVYGPNGAGKSSLIYALLTLKGIILNSNQNTTGFFNFGFATLGGFVAVAFDHKKETIIGLGISVEQNGDSKSKCAYHVAFDEEKGTFELRFREAKEPETTLALEVKFPYPANSPIQKPVVIQGIPLTITWNGITSQVQVTPPQTPGQTADPNAQVVANRVATFINSPVETLRKVSVVPLKRGFSKPLYSAVPVTAMLTTEDEVATMLSSNKYLVSKISYYLEKILDRDFRYSSTPGTAIFSLDATDKKTGVATELVNDGFGVNQTVYFLARTLAEDVEWVCVEEPEIHLHPTAVRSLAKALVNIVHEEGKNFLISTHSEAIVTSLLAEVAKGELKPNELACYMATKERKRTKFERQTVNENGQIRGGLANFLAGELEDVKAFLKVSD